ncbi:MAG: hypothetical protein P8J32_05220 [bacterium]|nr:hypothetical protein [bacterium]
MGTVAKSIAQAILIVLVVFLLIFMVKKIKGVEESTTTEAPVQVELKSEMNSNEKGADADQQEEKKKPKPEPTILASQSPYNDGSEVLNDKGKLEMWNLLEDQRETRHDFTQIIEAQKIFSELLLTKCDTNVFLMQVVMDGLDSLKKSYEQNNRELMTIDSKLIYYRFCLKEEAILKE